ncbi:MAG: glycerate kinase [Gemmatimonadota bacterium]|nr:glycerate kinase [Gemmatimonadota bacterium]
MRIVVAMDSFKGSVSAVEACEAVQRGLVAVLPHADVRRRPMADGGEGTAKTILSASRGEWVEVEVTGPLPPRRVTGGYAWLPAAGPGALVEMATASGLELLRPDELDPLAATTFGTGEQLAAAFGRRPAILWLAVGGSATVDGGTGAARALGWRFSDRQGRDVALGGAGLEDIHRIVPPPARLDRDVEVRVLCDVDNPLLGERGAARVFGPQKGATPQVVERLEAGLSTLAEAIERDLGVAVHDIPGAGAAGGLGAGAVAFLDADLVSGIEAVMDASGLDEALAGADWVITGEGRFDTQSLSGKVVSGVLARAERAGCKVAVLAGSLDAEAVRAAGQRIESFEAVSPPDIRVDEALQRGSELIEASAMRWARSLTRASV